MNPAVPAAWKRPLDVTPAAEQGKFKVISQTAPALDASLFDRLSMLSVALLFGMLVPLEWAALTKARQAAAAAGAGDVLGPVFGILSMSCCAPLLAPALLSFVGFSGTTLLNVNATLHELSAPLTVASLALLVLSIGLVSHTISAACSVASKGKLTAP